MQIRFDSGNYKWQQNTSSHHPPAFRIQCLWWHHNGKLDRPPLAGCCLDLVDSSPSTCLPQSLRKHFPVVQSLCAIFLRASAGIRDVNSLLHRDRDSVRQAEIAAIGTQGTEISIQPGGGAVLVEWTGEFVGRCQHSQGVAETNALGWPGSNNDHAANQ